jgi:hypothetical protein
MSSKESEQVDVNRRTRAFKKPVSGKKLLIHGHGLM